MRRFLLFIGGLALIVCGICCIIFVSGPSFPITIITFVNVVAGVVLVCAGTMATLGGLYFLISAFLD